MTLTRSPWARAVSPAMASTPSAPCVTTITGWVTKSGSAASAISPITESNRKGMLSLTTVISVTGFPPRSTPPSVTMETRLSPLRWASAVPAASAAAFCSMASS